jgi:hypothetical protein
MKKLIAALCIALAPVIAACSSPPKSGTVTEKQYKAPFDYTFYQPIMSCGKYGCTTIGFIPIPMHEGPHWWVHLQDDKDPKHTGWVEVDQTTYNREEVGAHYP